MKRILSCLVSTCLLIAILFAQPGVTEVRAMTPSSKGSLAIAEMTKMKIITWTANTSPKVIISGLNYYCGTIYKGMPYTWSADTSYSAFLSDPALVYAAPIYRYYLNQPKNSNGTNRALGNDCSTAVALAWRAAGSGVSKSIYTGTMFNAAMSSQSCMKKRGSYTAPTGSTTTTGWLTSSNYVAVYESMKPGDVCFYHYKKADGTYSGHAILITDVDCANDKVWYIDQIGGQSRIDSSAHSTWTSGTKSFSGMLNSGYVPITTSDITI